MSSTIEAKRILLVEDDETILASFHLILESEGFQVDTATSGQQALEKAGEKNYRLVILDIKLPDMHGIEVAKEMRKRDDEVNLVIMTGYPELAESIDTIDIGIEEILLKPVNVDELLRVIKDALAQAQCTT